MNIIIAETISGRELVVTDPHWRFDPLENVEAFGEVDGEFWRSADSEKWYRCAFGKDPNYFDRERGVAPPRPPIKYAGEPKPKLAPMKGYNQWKGRVLK